MDKEMKLLYLSRFGTALVKAIENDESDFVINIQHIVYIGKSKTDVSRINIMLITGEIIPLDYSNEDECCTKFIELSEYLKERE
jgi:hypothetical protein